MLPFWRKKWELASSFCHFFQIITTVKRNTSSGNFLEALIMVLCTVILVIMIWWIECVSLQKKIILNFTGKMNDEEGVTQQVWPSCVSFDERKSVIRLKTRTRLKKGVAEVQFIPSSLRFEEKLLKLLHDKKSESLL